MAGACPATGRAAQKSYTTCNRAKLDVWQQTDFFFFSHALGLIHMESLHFNLTALHCWLRETWHCHSILMPLGLPPRPGGKDGLTQPRVLRAICSPPPHPTPSLAQLRYFPSPVNHHGSFPCWRNADTGERGACRA